jgi:hypothetical protein
MFQDYKVSHREEETYIQRKPKSTVTVEVKTNDKSVVFRRLFNYAVTTTSLILFSSRLNVVADCLLLICVCKLGVESILARVIPFHSMIIVGIFY